jgi:hypothetical protein
LFVDASDAGFHPCGFGFVSAFLHNAWGLLRFAHMPNLAVISVVEKPPRIRLNIFSSVLTCGWELNF